ncbi:hypothetical protein C6P40_002673 [Pichia californica]|uniref:Uncharacterized protein n=1 Tax=Pichia californica TaxID=460514 RepID=A0A9P6WRD0_9ASCO|nr:hypothetical protein C6P42_001686 [[Candida] californica]KAG0691282.1 hypothetical protein C6P40_002673 [[Candida] californica]
MTSLKQTQTVTSKINPIFGDEFQIAATLPLERPDTTKKNRKPISIHLSKVGTNTLLGCYVYTIIDKRSDKIYQTLLNNSEETLVDMTKKIGSLISKKFSTPSYVSLSGDWSLEDLMVTVKETIKFVDESF